MSDALSARSDATIPEILDSIRYLGVAEKLDIFNAATGGAIVLESRPAQLAASGGEFTKMNRFKEISSLVNHMDEANPTGAIDTLKQEQAAGSTVYQAQRIGPVALNSDYAITGQATPDQCVANLATQFAEQQLVTIRDNLLAAGVAAIAAMDTPSADYHILDVARGKVTGAAVTATFSYLNTLRAKMGDRLSDIKTWVMPSAVYKDLIGDSLANYKVDQIAGTHLYREIDALFGGNLVVVDSPSLTEALTSSYPTEYFVLGLGKNALRATILHDSPVKQAVTLDTEVDSEMYRSNFYVEYAIAGMKYDQNPANPTNAELATTANWDEDLDDHRQCPIVMGVFNAA